MTAKYRHKKAEEFLDRASQLPTQLLADEDYKDFSGYLDDEGIAKQFAQRRLNKIGDFQDLILEVRGFVKITYGSDSEYFKLANSVDYLTQHKGYLLNSFNVNENNVWSEGRVRLISLLTNVIFEEKQRKEMEAAFDNPSRKTVIRIGVTALLLVCLLAVWNAPDTDMLAVFGKGKVFMARCGLSISLVPLYLIAFSTKDWVALVGIWAALFVAVLGFLR